MATRKLYDEDAYAREFDATVVEVHETEKDGEKYYDVILDRTLFFPEEGGQTCDRGNLRLGGLVPAEIEEEISNRPQAWNVEDVQIDGENKIHHILDQPIDIGTRVHGEIDWNHRFSNMQQHTGEHIFSGIVHAKKGYANVGFHLSDSVVTMDYDGELTDEEIQQIEYEANEAIIKNIPVHCYYPELEALERMDYRSKIQIDGAVRIVEISGVDCCACCAPHVKTTAEVGMLKVIGHQRYKGGIRLTILCGFRALRDYDRVSGIATMASQELSVSQDALVDAVLKQKEDMANLKVALGEANTRVMNQELSQVDLKAENVVLFSENVPNLVMRNAVNTLMEKHSGYAAVFNLDGNRYQFIIGSKERDARELSTLLREKYGAKGGGSSDMVQGSMEKETPMMEKEIRELFNNGIS